MKKKFLSLAILLVTICIFSVKTSAKQSSGNNDLLSSKSSDKKGTESDPLTLYFGSGPDQHSLVFPKTSPLYPLILSSLKSLHIKVKNNEVHLSDVTDSQYTLIVLYLTKLANIDIPNL